MKAGTQRDLHAHDPSSTTNNSQEVEATQMAIEEWKDKQNVVYTHKGINYSALKKDGNLVTCYNMDDPWGHYVKWNKPVKKDKYCMIPLMRYLK